LDGIVHGGNVQARDAGVVDEHVDLAEIGERLCGGALDRGRVRNADRVFLRSHIPDADRGARRFEALRDRGAYPLQAAGDDGGASLEIELIHSLTAPVMPET